MHDVQLDSKIFFQSRFAMKIFEKICTRAFKFTWTIVNINFEPFLTNTLLFLPDQFSVSGAIEVLSFFMTAFPANIRFGEQVLKTCCRKQRNNFWIIQGVLEDEKLLRFIRQKQTTVLYRTFVKWPYIQYNLSRVTKLMKWCIYIWRHNLKFKLR